jgi:hypothetical protein
MAAGDMTSGEDHHHQDRADPSGGMTPLPPAMTDMPMVMTRKNVPTNSITYLFIARFINSCKVDGKLRAIPEWTRVVEDTAATPS